MMNSLAIVTLLGLAPGPGDGIAVPQDREVESCLSTFFPVSLRRDPAGRLLVGAYQKVFLEAAPGHWTEAATGDFLATAVDMAPDGTLYIGDSHWSVLMGQGIVWALPPDAATPEMVCWAPGLWQGLAVLPGGDLLVVSEGDIYADTPLDGSLFRLPPSTRGLDLAGQPSILANRLRNPVSAEIGPDGAIYFLDRGFFESEAGSLYRFRIGDAAAEVVLTGLNDPYDTAWLADGSILITDVVDGRGIILRYDPSTGSLEPWATGFGALYGIDVAPNGDVYVCDGGVDLVYRIYSISVAVPMILQPETLNLKSHGKTVLAEIDSGPGLATSIRIVAIDGIAIDPIPALQVKRSENGVDARFSREALQDLLTAGNRVVRVEGLLESGAPFHAEDTLRVVGCSDRGASSKHPTK